MPAASPQQTSIYTSLLGTVALAAALPAFLRYNGKEGLARKIAEGEAWSAAAAARLGNPEPSLAPPPLTDGASLTEERA